MKHSMSESDFLKHRVSLKGIKMNSEVKSMNFVFFKRFTCKKSSQLKVIIFQNKARQQSTIMENITLRGSIVSVLG